MTRPAIVPRGAMPAGAGAALTLAPPGAPVPRLADGRSGSQRAAGYPEQMARGGGAGRRQDHAAATWCRREIAAGVTATARWLSQAVRSRPARLAVSLPGCQRRNLAPALAMNIRCARPDALHRRTGEQHEHR
jgi:hypothetical protein